LPSGGICAPDENEVESILPHEANVTTNGLVPEAVFPRVVTVNGANVAPGGTDTTILEAEAELIAALTPPNRTTLLSGTGLKFVPDMVTLVPIAPDCGLTEVIVAMSVGTPKPSTRTVSGDPAAP
jgi:hypothetical protein